jgi:hypothetical protein
MIVQHWINRTDNEFVDVCCYLGYELETSLHEETALRFFFVNSPLNISRSSINNHLSLGVGGGRKEETMAYITIRSDTKQLLYFCCCSYAAGLDFRILYKHGSSICCHNAVLHSRSG